MYSGSTNTGTVFNTIFLEDGAFWAIYGTQASASSTLFVKGFLQGSGTYNNGNFSSSNTRDYFGSNAPVSGNLVATYVAGASINGTASNGTQTSSFSGTTIPTSSYNYSQTANLSTIAGTWNLTGISSASVNISISTNGAFTAGSGGCTITGTITPRPSGRNVFNFAATTGASPCTSPGASLSGIALSYLINGGPARQLVIAGLNASRGSAEVYFGSK